jgi:AcrR family transcriptional regulator
MSRVSSKSWRGDPLPRGRHKLPRREVRASQRERLLRAMAEVVSAEGYTAATVPKVVTAARVSTNTFYELFDDKTDCFIAFCGQAGDELLAEMVPFGEEPEWLVGLDRGLDLYLRWWRDRRALTHAYLLELPGAGRRALEEKDRQQDRFTEMLRYIAGRARKEDPGLPPISDATLATAFIAPTEIIAREVREGRLERVLELKDELRYLLVKLLADDETAQRADRRFRGARQTRR